MIVSNNDSESGKQISNNDLNVGNSPSRKIIIVLLYILAGFGISLLQSTFLPISGKLQAIYQIEPWTIQLLNSIHLLFAVVIIIPAIAIIEHFGLKITIQISSILLIFAGWTRLLIDYSIWIVITCQLVVGIANALLTNSINNLVRTWFPPEKRIQAMMIINLANQIGGLIAILIPGLLFAEVESHIEHQQIEPKQDANWQQGSTTLLNTKETINSMNEKGKDMLFYILVGEALFATIISLFCIVLFQDKSQNDEHEDLRAQVSLGTQAKILLKNKDYIIVFVTFILIYGCSTVFMQLMPFSLLYYDYKDTFFVALMMTFPIIAGILGCIFVAIMIETAQQWFNYSQDRDRLQNIIGLVIILQIGLLVNFMIFYYALRIQNPIFLLTVTSTFGIFVLPIFPILLQLASDSDQSVGEGMKTALLFGFGSEISGVIGLIMTIIMSQFIHNVEDRNRGKILVDLQLISLGLLFLASIFVMLLYEKRFRLGQNEDTNSLLSTEKV